MLFATAGQGLLFVWMMAAGAAIGFWYLLVYLLRRFIQAGFWLTLACDLLFAAGTAVIFIAAIIAGNYGALRPFALLGTLFGAALFALAVCPPLEYLRNSLLRASRKIMAFTAKNRLIKVIFK